MTDHITGRLTAIFGDPAQKKAMQEPIRDKLARSQMQADEENARRRVEQGPPVKRKQQYINL